MCTLRFNYANYVSLAGVIESIVLPVSPNVYICFTNSIHSISSFSKFVYLLHISSIIGISAYIGLFITVYSAVRDYVYDSVRTVSLHINEWPPTNTMIQNSRDSSTELVQDETNTKPTVARCPTRHGRLRSE